MLRFSLPLLLFWLPVYCQTPDIIAVDANGNIYTGGGVRAFVAKSAGHSELWRADLRQPDRGRVLTLLPVPDGVWAGGAAGRRGFLTRLNVEGRIVAEADFDTPVRALAIDTAGSVYLARDGFLEKLGPAGKPVYSVAVKSPVTALAADSAGSLYATVGASIAKRNSDGTEWLWSVDLGPSSPLAIAVDATGSAYVTGTTRSLDFPILAAAQPRMDGPSDAFVTKVKADGSGFEWSTYLGGRGADTGTAVAMDGEGNLWVAGYTTSSDFPGSPASAAVWHGAEDGFLARLNSQGAVMESRYFGSPGNDRIQSLAIDTEGNPHVAGWNDEGAVRSFSDRVSAFKAAAVAGFDGSAPTSSPLAIQVSNLDDSGPGSLRDLVATSPSGTTIIFPRVKGKITLLSRILINKNLTIQGPGQGIVTIDGAGKTRLFFIQGGNVSISLLTLSNGLAKGGNASGGGAGAGMGGAIFQNGGSLTLTQVTVQNNRALGGDQVPGNALGGGGFGGNAPLNGNGAGGGDLGGAGGVVNFNGFGGNGGDGAGGATGFNQPGNGGFAGGGGGFGGSGGKGGFGGGGGFGGADIGGGIGGFGGGGNGAGGGAGFGGAIFIRSGSLTLVNVGLFSNTAAGGSGNFGGTRGQGKGGALFILQGATATASNVLFSGNVAAQAGVNSTTGYDGTPAGAKQCPGQDTVDVCGVLPVNLVVAQTLTRDSGGNLLVTITVANVGGTAAENVVLTNLAINGVRGGGLPVSLGSIAAAESSTVTLHLPGTAGVPGAAGVLAVGGYYSGGSFNGGSFNYASRVTLP